MPTFDPAQNAVLAMLPPAVIDRIDRGVAVVTVETGDVLLDAGERIDDVYFPLDTVLSLDQATGTDPDDPAIAPAVALVGSEGMIGFEALFGSDTSFNRVTARIGGRAVRLSPVIVHDEFARAGAFHRLLLRSTDALFAQIGATSACERAHTVQQRLVRWLLSFDDRVPVRTLGLTQESLAQLLGVRRVSVSAAASQFQEAGLIAYRRGMVTILDRKGLVERSCRCYREIRTRYEGFLQPG